MTRITKGGFIVAVLGLLLLAAPSAFANECLSNASGNWNAAATWTACGGVVPTSADTVEISGGHTVTVNVANAVAASVQVGGNLNAGAGNLAFNAASQLTVSGNVTLGSSTSVSNNGTITMTLGGTLTVGGLSLGTLSSNTWTPGTGTVELTATNTLPATVFTTFNNLNITGGTTTLSASVAVNNFSITSGTVELNTSTLTISGNATYSSGTINNGTVTSTGATTNFAGTTFGAVVNATSDALNLNGSTFNNAVTLTKNGATNILSNGGNTFNSTATITVSGSGYLALAGASADVFNGDVTLACTGTGSLHVAHNSTGNRFSGNVTFNNTGTGGAIVSSFTPIANATYNGNIVVNNTSTLGIYFGAAGGLTTLATGKTITVGGTGFTAGNLFIAGFTQTGTTAQALSLTGTTLLQLGPAVTFNGNVNFSSPQLLLNGGTYFGTASFTKSGATDNTSNGGNTFHSTTNITNTGSGWLVMGNASPDIFNGNTTFTNNSANALWVAHNSPGNQFNGNVTYNNLTASGSLLSCFGPLATAAFNGNIVVNNTSSAGVYFGAIAGSSTTLAAGKTITVGSSGFNAGRLLLSYITQLGTTAQALTFTGTALLEIGPSAVFNGNVNFVAPQVLINGGTFNGTAYIEKTGATQNNSLGGNVFNATTTLVNSGSAHFVFGFPTGIDRFNGDLILTNRGAAGLYVAYNSAGHQFNGNILVNQTSVAGVISFCGGTGTATLASGKTLAVGASGFSSGILLLERFTQIGATAQTISLTGTALLQIGASTIFNGSVNFTAPQLVLNGATFNGAASLTKNGATGNTSTGGNVFNSTATITNSGTGFLRLANTTGDNFNGNATFIQTGSGLLQPAYATNSTFAGNLSTSGTATAILFGTGTGTATFNGTGAQSVTGSSSPTFFNLTISNSGNTVTAGVNLTVTNDLSVTSGTFDLAGFTANRLTTGGTLTLSNNTTLKIGSTNTLPSNFTTHSIGATSTIEYGGANQPVAVLNSLQDYGNLKVSGTGTKTLAGNVNVAGNLVLTSATITTGTNTLYVKATGTVTRVSGHVVGNLKLNVATGANSKTFDVGDAGNYTPVTVTFASVTASGDLAATVTAGDHPNIGASTINAFRSANRNWTLTNSGVAFTTYAATFTFVAGDLDSGATTSAFVAGTYNAGWTYPTVGNKTSVTMQVTGLTTFGDFQLGEAAPPSVALVTGVTPSGPQSPGTELTYTVAFTNNGGQGAQAFVVVDPIPANTDFRIGSASASLATTGMTVSVEYSNDNAATWTYTPISGGGGAPANFDRLVTHVRWRFNGTLSQSSPNNTGSVSLTARIR